MNIKNYHNTWYIVIALLFLFFFFFLFFLLFLVDRYLLKLCFVSQAGNLGTTFPRIHCNHFSGWNYLNEMYLYEILKAEKMESNATPPLGAGKLMSFGSRQIGGLVSGFTETPWELPFWYHRCLRLLAVISSNFCNSSFLERKQ